MDKLQAPRVDNIEKVIDWRNFLKDYIPSCSNPKIISGRVCWFGIEISEKDF